MAVSCCADARVGCVSVHSCDVTVCVGVLQGMYSCISGRLAAQDQDQEVKEAAIMAMAALIAQLGDVLSAEVRISRVTNCVNNQCCTSNPAWHSIMVGPIFPPVLKLLRCRFESGSLHH